MRRQVVIACLASAVFGLAAPSALAQTSVLKLNVLSPFAKTGSLFYENAFSYRSSAQLGLLYTGFTYKKATARGFALTPEYRYYLQSRKQSPFGFYAGAFIRLQSLAFTRNWTYTRELQDPQTGVIKRIEVSEEA